MTERLKRLLDEHTSRHGAGNRVRVFRAPGRVNLIGEHTDYNDGFVLPAAIDRDVLVTASARADRQVRLYALDFGTTAAFDLDALEDRQMDGWGRYPFGVAAVLAGEGMRLCGVEGVIQGTVPIGAGLSSSAALEVAVATMLCGMAGVEVPGPRLAQLCQRAEHEYAGVRCGIMDQFVSCLARPQSALFLDCRTLDCAHIPFEAPGYALVIANTNRPRGLAGSAYNQRRQECEEGVRLLGRHIPGIRALRDVSPAQFTACRAALPDVIARRCEHVVFEDDRVIQSVEALRNKDFAGLGRLMNASHDSLRDLYEVSCRELDVLVDIARQCDGVAGSRMTGAGFGGCTVSLVRSGRVTALETAIRDAYPAATGYEPEVYVCQPAAGAGEESTG
jgi:galactokinase